MNTKKIVCILVVLLVVNITYGQNNMTENQKRSSFNIYASEFGGSLIGTCCIGGLGCVGVSAGLALIGLASVIEIASGEQQNASGANELIFGGILILSVMPVSASFGTHQVAKRINTEGNFRTGVLGGVVGSVVGFGFGYGISRINPEKISWIIFPTALLCNSIGAVIGYNSSRPKSSTSQGYYNHFDPPSLGLRLEKTDDNKTITALDFKLINARF